MTFSKSRVKTSQSPQGAVPPSSTSLWNRGACFLKKQTRKSSAYKRMRNRNDLDVLHRGCPAVVDISNWLGSFSYPDTFNVEVSAGCYPNGGDEEASVSYLVPTARAVGSGVCAETNPYTPQVGGDCVQPASRLTRSLAHSLTRSLAHSPARVDPGVESNRITQPLDSPSVSFKIFNFQTVSPSTLKSSTLRRGDGGIHGSERLGASRGFTTRCVRRLVVRRLPPRAVRGLRSESQGGAVLLRLRHAGLLRVCR